MIVLRNGHKVYYPKLSIRGCLTLDKIYGDVTAPLLSYMSLETQILIVSLSLQHYHLTEDELYDLIDTVDDLNSLILELYSEGGLISLGEQESPSDVDSVGDTEQSSEVITFESQMMELLEQCMSIGMREEDFYNSTIKQITRYVESYNKQQENQLQEKAFFDYQLANLIGMSVARLLSKDAKYPTFEKAYPFINKDAKTEVDEEWEMEVQHNRLREWAEQINKKFKADEVE